MKNKEEAILTFGLQADVQYTPDLREGQFDEFLFEIFLLHFFEIILNKK